MENDDFTISEDDLKQIVLNIFERNKRILSHSLEPISTNRVGLLGEHAILRLVLEDKEVSFFVKTFPKHPAPAEFAEGTGAFKKEIFIYKLFEIIKDSGICILNSVVPDCYLSKNKVLILDNLIHQGFETLNKHEWLDYETVSVVLDSLAKLHSASLIYEEKKGDKYRLTDEFSEDFEESFFNDRDDYINKSGIEASIRGVLREIDIFEFGPKLDSGKNFNEVLEKVLRDLFRFIKPSTKYRNVVCHGDLWATNFLIRDKMCKFVDFQCARYVPPAHDVMCFIYLTTSRDFRGQHMYNLLGFYYNCLEKHVKSYNFKLTEMIPFQEFLESCEEQKVFAMIETAIYFPLILINSGDIEKYFSNAELNKKTLQEDRSHLIVEHLVKDKHYEMRLRESVQDLKDYCDYL